MYLYVDIDIEFCMYAYVYACIYFLALLAERAKNAWPEFNDDETSGNPKIKSILQSNRPVLFKNVKTMKEKERKKHLQVKGDYKESIRTQQYIFQDWLLCL